LCVVNVFFFSSRRRHTRWPRDWSSDVCSSDLLTIALHDARARSWSAIVSASSVSAKLPRAFVDDCAQAASYRAPAFLWLTASRRSEERRVGKECRSRVASELENDREGDKKSDG